MAGLIGPEALRELEGDAHERYSCWRCWGPGRTTDPTAVVVLAYKSAQIIEFAHAHCVTSRVVQLDADRPADMEAFGAGDMNSKAAVLEYPAGPRFRAVLVREPAVEMAAVEPGGERANLWMSSLIEQGLTSMRTESQEPRAAAGWQLRLGADATASVLTPGGVSVHEGPCPVWEDWLDVAGGVGGCVVLVGTAGLYAVSDEGMTAPRFQQLLDGAARDGALVGGIVPVSLRA